MNEDAVSLMHDIRNKLTAIKGMVHMHMMGERRYMCEKELAELESITGKLWALCVGCEITPASTRPKDGG
jgi:sensor histidine kinase regulating citrate/malate metabolism